MISRGRREREMTKNKTKNLLSVRTPCRSKNPTKVTFPTTSMGFTVCVMYENVPFFLFGKETHKPKRGIYTLILCVCVCVFNVYFRVFFLFIILLGKKEGYDTILFPKYSWFPVENVLRITQSLFVQIGVGVLTLWIK